MAIGTLDPEHAARRLGFSARNLLIEHAKSGIVDVDISNPALNSIRGRMIAGGYLRPLGDTPKHRPSATELTDYGRAVVCLVLSDYADALVMAGALDETQPNAQHSALAARLGINPSLTRRAYPHGKENAHADSLPL